MFTKMTVVVIASIRNWRMRFLLWLCCQTKLRCLINGPILKKKAAKIFQIYNQNPPMSQLIQLAVSQKSCYRFLPTQDSLLLWRCINGSLNIVLQLALSAKNWQHCHKLFDNFEVASETKTFFILSFSKFLFVYTVPILIKATVYYLGRNFIQFTVPLSTIRLRYIFKFR